MHMDIKDAKQGVEELGVVFDKFGKAPMESRVFACLLLSDPPYRSFQEIVDFLGASKSAISNALSNLQKEGTVTYRTFSGDRKRYFEVSTEGWRKSILDRATQIGAINNTLRKVLQFRKDSEYKEMNAELEKILQFQMHLSTVIERCIREWDFK